MKRTITVVILAGIATSVHCGTTGTLTRQWIEKERAKRAANVERLRRMLALEEGAAGQMDLMVKELDASAVQTTRSETVSPDRQPATMPEAASEKVVSEP